MPIPALPAGHKPNFIVILTDDQGWDDIGLHNPKYVNTPNLDKFIRGGTLFSNFYVTPQCAQTRAALMTGRHYPRTGTMLVHAGALCCKQQALCAPHGVLSDQVSHKHGRAL